MNKILSAIVSMFVEDQPSKDPWVKWRNPGGPISPAAGEAMLFFVGIGVLIYMIVKF